MSRVLVMLCAVLLGVTVRAQEPTSKPADLSSPRAALRTFVDALKDGDAKKAQQVCQATDPQMKKLTNAGVAWQAALEKLISVCEKKFGDGMAAPVRAHLQETGPADFVPAVEQHLNDAPEADVGESLTVNLGEDQPPMEMVRVDGKWKIDVDKALAQMQPPQRQLFLREWPKATKKLQDATKAVEAGKITSVDDVISAIAPASGK